MLSRIACTAVRRCVPTFTSYASRAAPRQIMTNPSLVTSPQRRTMGTLEESVAASEAWEKSCYLAIDFTVDENATVYEAVQKLSAYNVGCLVTVDSKGDITGVVSERDYVNKIALLDRNSKDTLVNEISTKTARLVTASPSDSVHDCLNKMLSKEIRHLPLINDDGKVIGMLSVKDLVQSVVDEKEKALKTLSDFALGKGGHFGGE